MKTIPPSVSGGRRRIAVRSGTSWVELLAVVLILSFVMAATAKLYYAGGALTRRAGGYSQAQTDLDTALRRVTRTIRHGYALTHTSTKTNFPSGSSTNVTQILVPIPEADTDGSHKEVRIYYANGGLYAQRSDTTGAGILLISGLQTSPVGVQFRYFNDTGSSVTEVAATPEQATEVQVTLTAVRSPATTAASARVTLRNKLLGP